MLAEEEHEQEDDELDQLLEAQPKLQRELKPGTRIVSHNYDMGDWRPLRQLQIDDHKVYLWVIPEKTPTAVR